MIRIRRTVDDWQEINKVADKRHKKYKNVPSNYGTERDYHKDWVGAAGEYFVAKYFGLEWTGRDDDNATDVEFLEVRTRTKPGGLLCIHDKEIERKKLQPGQKYVLCWNDDVDDSMTIVGWAFATEIRKANIYANGRWYIPTNKLHPIHTVLL